MTKLQAELKRLHSPDVSDLHNYQPESLEDFGILLQAMFGPVDSDGEESFDIFVCTAGWIARTVSDNVLSGRHHLIVRKFDICAIRAFLVDYAATCEGTDWNQVALKLSRIGKWEFEDHRAD